MRQAYFDISWLEGKEGRSAGLALGYDRCGEHEFGIKELLNKFGISLPDLPTTMDDYQITRVPSDLHFFNYTARSKDKRRKAGYPAALLLIGRLPYGTSADKPAEVAAKVGLGFWPDHPADKGNRPQYDLLTAWGSSELAVHARGEQNIANLQKLHDALLRLDVCFATPWQNSFFRGGISLVIASEVPDEEKEAVAKRFADNNELTLAARATGIYETLLTADKQWYALSPGWTDAGKTQVEFFLNPRDQQKYSHGWFSVEELQQWTHDEGPAIGGRDLDKLLASLPQMYNWSIRLGDGLQDSGIKLRLNPHLCWFDKAARVLGVRLRVHSGDMNDGIYPLDQFMAEYARPLPVKAKA